MGRGGVCVAAKPGREGRSASRCLEAGPADRHRLVSVGARRVSASANNELSKAPTSLLSTVSAVLICICACVLAYACLHACSVHASSMTPLVYKVMVPRSLAPPVPPSSLCTCSWSHAAKKNRTCISNGFFSSWDSCCSIKHIYCGSHGVAVGRQGRPATTEEQSCGAWSSTGIGRYAD